MGSFTIIAIKSLNPKPCNVVSQLRAGAEVDLRMRDAFEVLAPGRLLEFVVLCCQELLAGAVPVLQGASSFSHRHQTCARVKLCQVYWAINCACVRWWCRIPEPWPRTAATAISRANMSCCRATLRLAFHAYVFDVVVHGPVRKNAGCDTLMMLPSSPAPAECAEAGAAHLRQRAALPIADM